VAEKICSAVRKAAAAAQRREAFGENSIGARGGRLRSKSRNRVRLVVEQSCQALTLITCAKLVDSRKAASAI